MQWVITLSLYWGFLDFGAGLDAEECPKNGFPRLMNSLLSSIFTDEMLLAGY
jgi:hypothetical protein